jgi:hypothetical protein
VPRWYLNLFIVFLISGLWHGANWTFIFWGALHGCFLVYALITAGFRQRVVRASPLGKIKWLHSAIQIITTFTLVTLAWIFFRGNSLHDINLIIRHIFSMYHAVPFESVLKDPLGAIVFTKSAFLISIVMIILTLGLEYKVSPLLKEFNGRPVLDTIFMTVVIFLILFFGVFHNSNFIYFQF